MIDDGPRATFLSRAVGVLRIAAFALAVVSIVATFLLVTGYLNAVLTLSLIHI